MRVRALLPIASLVVGGCFTWHPVTAAPPAGNELEALLSNAGTARLTAIIGPDASSILGTVTGTRGDTLDLAIAEVRTRGGLTYYLRGTTVGLVGADLASMRVRQLDKRRTAIAATAGVLGAAALAAGVSAISGGMDNTGGGGTTPAVRPPR